VLRSVYMLGLFLCRDMEGRLKDVHFLDLTFKGEAGSPPLFSSSFLNYPKLAPAGPVQSHLPTLLSVERERGSYREGKD